MARIRAAGSFVFAIFVTGLAFVAAPPAKADFLGIDWTGSVYNINQATGQSRKIGSSGYNMTNGLTSLGNGTFLTIASKDNLVRIDPATGRGTAMLKISFPDSDIVGASAVAYSPSYGLLASCIRASQNNTDRFFRINMTTGVATELSGASLTGDATYTPDGRLYAWQGNLGLEERNPQTAAFVRQITQLPIDQVQSYGILGLTSTPTGELYGGHYQLYRIDRNTGVPSSVGTISPSMDLRGLAYIPEPASACLLALGGAWMSICSRRTRRKVNL